MKIRLFRKILTQQPVRILVQSSITGETNHDNEERNHPHHPPPAGANLFLELGFDPKEARTLHESAQQEIHDLLALKEQLMAALSQWIDEKQLKQADAARILMISRPRVSDLVNRKFHLFTIDTLIGMLRRIGKTVTLSIS